ncbi:MAG: hypothetical protein KGR26_14945 [Cyanobacteria bacterium REEB65]|nr:hypothetical protein [Cyanobacteria bacterium REEB65]
MRASQRGNAILISAILVLALTVAALGISRLLVSWIRQASTQKYLLGVQATALAKNALEQDIAALGTPPPSPATPKPAPASAPYNFASGFGSSTATVSVATVSTTWVGPNSGPSYSGTASVTFAGTASSTAFAVSRQLAVTIASNAVGAPEPWKITITGVGGGW